MIFTRRFQNEIKAIFDFIADDSYARAVKFYDELISKIENIENNPLAYPKSKTAKRDNARDLIYKGYVIPFLIYDEIHILGIYKHNIWKP